MTRLSSRFLAVMAVVGVAIVASLVGGVGVGHASTTFNVQLTPLIAAGSGDPVPQVSLGSQIGYHLFVHNGDTNNTTHVQIIVSVPTGTFKDASDSNCAAAKGDPSTMVCIPPGGTMAAGSDYNVDFRFTAPTTNPNLCPDPENPPPAQVPCITASPSVTIAAKTQGNPGNNGTTVGTGSPVIVFLNSDGATNDTYLRTVDPAAGASGPQNFSAKLPNAIFGPSYGVELGIHNETGTPICPTCLGTDTSLTIPAASTVLEVGNPFYDPTQPPPASPYRPYTWTMSATTVPSFKLLGIYHLEDGSDTAVQILACAVTGGPTPTNPVCYDTLTTKTKGGVQTLTATGRGLENGKITFGS